MRGYQFLKIYASLKNNLVDTMLNVLGKKRIRVDTMPDSFIRKINSLRSRYHALRLTNIEYLDVIGTLAHCLSHVSMVSSGFQNPNPF